MSPAPEIEYEPPPRQLLYAMTDTADPAHGSGSKDYDVYWLVMELLEAESLD